MINISKDPIKKSLFQYDKNSIINFKQVLEAEYLSQVFSLMHELEPNIFDVYDFYVFSNGLKDAQPAIEKNKKVVIIHISDERGDFPFYAEKYGFVFKNYLPKSSANIFPLQLGYACPPRKNSRFVLASDRKQDVFFSGYLNRNRFYIWRALLAPYIPKVILYPLLLLKYRFKFHFGSLKPVTNNGFFLNFTDGFGKGLDCQEYIAHLADSKIVLCPRGFLSSETFRHYEACGSGAIILTEEMPKNNVYNDASFILIDKSNKIIDQIGKLLENHHKLNIIQSEHIKFYESNLSPQATAKSILKVLKDKL